MRAYLIYDVVCVRRLWDRLCKRGDAAVFDRRITRYVTQAGTLFPAAIGIVVAYK